MKIEHFLKTTKKLPIPLKAMVNMLILSGKIRREMNELLKQYEISEPQFNVLRILRGRKGKPANLKTLQERMVHETSNTTRLVDKLIEKKLVERIIPKENRRKVEITITPEGLALLSKIDPVFKKFQNRIVSNLEKKEVGELNRILEKMGGWPDL